MGAREYFAGKSVNKGGAKAYFATDDIVKNYSENVLNRINSLYEQTNSFFDETNNYYKGLDSSAYNLEGATEWYKSVTDKQNQFKQEWDEIDKLLTEGESYLDYGWITQMRTELSKLNKERSRISSSASKDIEYWESWDEIAKESGTTAEEAYKHNYYSNKYNGYSYADIQDVLLKMRNNEYEGETEGEMAWLTNNADSFMSSEEAQKQIDALNEAYGFGKENWLESNWNKLVNTLDKTWNGEQMARGRYEELYAIKSNAERKEKMSEMVAGAKADPDYGNYVSQGEAWGLQFIEKEWEQEGYTFTDRVYNDQLVGHRSGDGYSTKTENFVKHMTDEEYNDYLYFLGKYGKETAQEYLDLIELDVNSREALDIRNRLDNPWARHFQLPQLFSLYAGLDQFASGIEGLFSDGYEAPSEYQIAQGLIREDQNAGGKIAMDLGQTTGNMLPSILASAIATYALGPGGFGVAGTTMAKAVGGAIGTFGVMGPSAAGNARQEMLNLGYSEAQANTYGALTGISEASLQYILGGIGKLGSGLTDDAIKSFANGFNSAGAKFAIEFGADIAGEALEESLQEVLDPFFKSFATGQKFEGIDWGQVAYSGFLGALSAGVLNGMGEVGTRASELSIAKGIKGNESKVNALKEIAGKQSVSNLAQKLATKIDTKTGAWKIADLIHEMNGTLSEQNVADIKYQLVRSGVLEADAQTIAEYLGKAVDGDYLTATQRKALDTNPIISRVFKKVVIDQNSTVNQRLNTLMDIYGNEGHAGVDYSAIAKSQSKEGLSYSANVRSYLENEVGDDSNNAINVPYMKQKAIKEKYGIGRSESYNAMMDSKVAEVKALMHNAKVSESGKTTDTTTGKEVSIKKIKDAKAKMFELADGSTISSKNIAFSTDDEAILYETVLARGYDTDTANAVINGLKAAEGLTATQYLNGVDEAIEYGKYGYPMDKISTNGFYADLSDPMKKFAYNLGKDIASKETASAQARVDKSKGKVIQTRSGNVIIDEDIKGMTSRQEASITTLGKMVTDITHSNVHIFESVEKVVNGKKVRVFSKDTAGFKAGTIADNGFYDKSTGDIYIDLHAGANAEGVILWTAAHELTHFIHQWSPAKFKVLADFLVKEYGKQGVSISTLIDNKIAESKRKKLTRDEAYEEVVADAMQSMFTDANAIEKAEKLKNTDKGLWNKIKQFFADLYKRITKEYDGLEAQTWEDHYVRQMSKKTIERLSNLFAEALVDAGNTYGNVDIQAVASGEVDIDGNESSHAMSIRSMAEGAGLSFEYNEQTGEIRILDMLNGTEVTKVTKEQIKDAPLGNIVSIAKENGFITDAEANKQYGFLADLVNLCLNYKENFTMVWEIAGTQVFSAIKANSDTQYGKTIDFSTVCKKTQQVINVISETQKRLKRGLTKDEIKDIVYYETGKAKEPTPCPVCYVFSRWMGIGGILQQMSDFQKKYEGVSEAEMRNFINDVESEIIKHANTPNKKGNLKADFFDKYGKPKFGTVIADLKAKANSKIKSANIRLQIQEVETLLEKADISATDKAKLQKKLARLNKKLETEGDVLDAKLKDAEALLNRYEEYQWLTKTYMDEVVDKDKNHIGWKFDPNFKSVPDDVLWDLREGARFATDYPKSWLYRTTKGCNAGKAILPYSDARVGETIQGVAYSDVKDILKGEHNAFLNGDKKAQLDYVTKAIKKQLAQNLIGGMRYQSTSDFRYEYGSDYLMTFLEMQAIGAKVQLYTKVIEAVDFLCTMGAEVNMSVMPLEDGYIIHDDGTKQLLFSTVTGINAEAAIAKSKQYDNAQLILVGISDEHIRLALEGDDVNGDVVSFVIPFHGSGNTVKAIQELMGLIGEKLDVTKAQDYSLVQTDHFAKNRTAEQTALWDLRKKIISRSYKKDGKTVAWDGKLTTAEEALLNSENGSKFLKDLYNRFYVDKNADEYGVSLSTDQAEQIFPYEYWDKTLTYAEADMNGERFKEYCATMGIIPRFSGVDSSGKELGYGNFTNTKGYWKLLIDRKMYNNDGTYHNPSKINVTNFKAETLDPAWGSATYEDVMQSDTDPKKTNAITENVIRQINGKDNLMMSERGSTIYIKDGHTEDGETVDFINLILDGKKKGETRTHKNLTRKWVGIAKDGYVYGRVRFGEPYLIDKNSPEYKDSYIKGTDYDLKDGKTKYYYPILETEDFRDAPKPIEKPGNYGTYSYSERTVSDFAKHMNDLIKQRGEWYGKDVFDYVDAHPELNFIDRIYEKDKAVKKDLEAFLNGVNNVNDLENLSWFMCQAFKDKNSSWWGNDYPYRGATRTFQNAVKKRINAIMTERVGGTNLGVSNGEVTLKSIEDMFFRLNKNDEIGELAQKVFATADTLGVNIRFANQMFARDAVGDARGDMVEYKTSYFNDTAVADQEKARVILHELIHSCTYYAWQANKTTYENAHNDRSENYKQISKAIVQLNRIYEQIRYDPSFQGQYGITDAAEMIAELSNEKFAGLLKKKNLWDTILDAIAKLFGYTRGNTAYDSAMQCLDYILDNPEITAYKDYARGQRRATWNTGEEAFGKTEYTDSYGNNRIMYSERILMGSLFSGGGTLEAGLVYQMLDKEFAVEYKSQLATVYADNHGKEHLFVGDVKDFDSKGKRNVFYLHASPSCPNYSPASNKGGETETDIITAEATARILEEQMPQAFTVENVRRYIGSEAYNIIANKLTELGYKWDVDVYKASDYGNATKRERMIIRAVKDGELPAKPAKVANTTSWGEATRDLWETDLIPSNLVKSKIEAIRNTPQLKNLRLTKLDKPLMIYDTTKSKLATFAWADELAPTLTTKCGDARIIMPDGKVYAPTPKFMGRIQGLPDNYKYPKATTNAFKIIGNGIPTQLTKAVIGGVLDSAYEQTHDGDILYSERNPNAIDNRTLLANALESVAQNPVEQEWLAKYKSQIADLNEKQNKLAEIRAEIKNIRFTKGADRIKVTKLENKAKTLANSINYADKKLLQLEASEALKGVVDRERAKAYKRGKAKADEYRKDWEMRSVRNYYRPRMEKIVSDLQNRLEHPSAKTAIPEAFGASVAKVLSAFNFTTYDKNGNPRPSKANVTRAEARASLEALANQLSQNSLETKYGQLDIPPEMLEWIKSVATVFEAAENLAQNEFIVNKMSEEQLKTTYKFLRSLQTSINNAGKYYTNASYDASKDGKSTIDHLDALPKEVNEKVEKASKMFKWDFASPVTVFDRFGEGGKHVYNMLVKGQSKMAYNSQKIIDFVDNAYTTKEAKEWRETLTTVTIGGTDYDVPVEMLMGLHCLLKQEDSRRHILEGGGIRFGDVKHKGKVKRFTNVFFNEIDAMAVEKALDKFPRAREVAEAMQKFMQEQGSSWGNEISMTRFGYHAYTTDLYYPIRTIKAGSEYEAQRERANIYALLNKSFTKERNPDADNAVIVDGIFSVFNNHMSEMALYNAWALPVIDAIKWFNYKETQDVDAKVSEKSVHETLRLAYGNYADEYVRRLFESINSQTDNGLSEEWAFLNLRKVNRVAVSWNVRVGIQQPFSVTRAFELINPKYVTPLVGKARREAYNELLEYSGIALWKSLGYYDADVSKPMEAKVLKNESLADKVSDVGMKAAEDGDQFTWTALWNACKKETAGKISKEDLRKKIAKENEGVDEKTINNMVEKAFLNKVAERFDDLVLRTQVVDSVLTKPQWQRSKGFWHKSTSAFMSEPLASYNALLRQYDNYSRDVATKGVKYAAKNNAKGIVRATGIFILTQVVNAMVTAPLDALRDDDDYETYLEKVLASFKENAMMNLLPTSLLPYVSDIVEYYMYGRTDRPDLGLFVNAIDLGKQIWNLCDPDKYSYYKLHKTFDALLKVGSQLSGFAVSNAFRDVLSVYNAVAGELGYGELKFQTAEDTHTEGYKRLYEAIFDGNEGRAEELYGQLLSNELDEEKVYDGLVKVLKDKFTDGDLTPEEATERIKSIIDFTGKTNSDGSPITDDDIYWMIDKWGYTKENGSADDYSKYDDIFTAMEDGDPSEAIEWHIEKKLDAYVEEARAEAEANGKSFNEARVRRESKSKAESAVKSAITAHYKKLYKEAYKNNDTEEMKRIRYMLKATKLYGTTSDLLNTCKGWLKD